MNKFDLILTSSRMLTPSVIHLGFRPATGAALDFIPGQFITFLFTDENDKIIRRSYSISSIPGSTEEIEIAVSPVAGGFATNIFFNLTENTMLPCSGPFGRLILKTDEQPNHYVLAATGTGISPYRAMLPTIAERLAADPNLQVTVLLGVQYRHDLLYAADFVAFAEKYSRFNFRAYLSREKELTHAYEYLGYVQSAFNELNLNPEVDLVYLCGNPNMIDDSFALLQEMGFPTPSIRREKYISAK